MQNCKIYFNEKNNQQSCKFHPGELEEREKEFLNNLLFYFKFDKFEFLSFLFSSRKYSCCGKSNEGCQTKKNMKNQFIQDKDF